MTTSENKVIDLQNQLDKANETRRVERTEHAVKTAISMATDLGSPTASAVQDIIRRTAKETELADDGSIKLKSGQSVVDYVRSLKETAPHLFRLAPTAKATSIAGMPKAEFDKLPAPKRLQLARLAGL